MNRLLNNNRLYDRKEWVLIVDLFRLTCAIGLFEVASLNHKAWNDAVKVRVAVAEAVQVGA